MEGGFKGGSLGCDADGVEHFGGSGGGEGGPEGFELVVGHVGGHAIDDGE